jgi:hypothetical protein
VVLAFVSAVDYFRLFWREALRPTPRPAAAPTDKIPEALPNAPHPGPLSDLTSVPPGRRS